jgi:hypothetical protein
LAATLREGLRERAELVACLPERKVPHGDAFKAQRGRCAESALRRRPTNEGRQDGAVRGARDGGAELRLDVVEPGLGVLGGDDPTKVSGEAREFLPRGARRRDWRGVGLSIPAQLDCAADPLGVAAGFLARVLIARQVVHSFGAVAGIMWVCEPGGST